METKKKELSIKERATNAVKMLAVMLLIGGIAYAGIEPAIEIYNTFFATAEEGITTTGFAPPGALVKGSLYTLTGSFENGANQAHTIYPKASFVSDTEFASANEFGPISLNGTAGTCALTTTTVTKDTIECEFDPISLDEAGGVAPSTGDIDFDFEIPLMWDGSELNIAMEYSD